MSERLTRLWAVVDDSGKWEGRRADIYDSKEDAEEEARARRISVDYCDFKWRVTQVDIQEVAQAEQTEAVPPENESPGSNRATLARNTDAGSQEQGENARPGSTAPAPSEGLVKVMQTTPDNCMNACLATYFGCRIEDTPPMDSEDWRKDLREWVRPRGLGFVSIAVPNEEVFKEHFSDGYLIVSGESARGRNHAVIYKDGKLWHDPHPESGGIKSVEQADFFYCLAALALSREAEDAERYRWLRSKDVVDTGAFAVMQPRMFGHIAFYGEALDDAIDAARRGS